MSLLKLGVFVVAAMICKAQLPTLQIPEPFGVNVHYLKNPEEELTSIYQAGFRIVRIDIPWNRAEKQRGVFDFSEIEPLLLGVAAHKMRPLVILHSSNSLYEAVVSWTDANNVRKQETMPPQHAESRKAFASFAGRAAEQFARANPIWEIWNEPDTSGFWPPEPNAAGYAALATEACRAIKRSAPGATVIAPGAAIVPKPGTPKPNFLTSVLESSLVDCVDAVSVHPYLWVDQLEWTPVMWRETRGLIENASFSVNSRHPAVVSSESGLSTYKTSPGAGATDETQASYLVRMMLLNFADSIPISVWYDWRDDGDNPSNPEDHYGLTTVKGSEKPAYRAMTAMARVLKGARLRCRLPSDDSTQLLLTDLTGKKNYLAVWTNRGRFSWKADDSMTLSTNTKLTWSSAVDLFGAPAEISRQGDRLSIRGFQPFYVTVDPTSAREACEHDHAR